MDEIEYGEVEGSICLRRGCMGVIESHEVEGCSCHINPPCSACVEPREYCTVCGWEAKDDISINGFKANVNRETGVYRTWTPIPLDKTKIDWRSKSHTHFSMIKEGCYPEGTTKAEVLEKVKGTFGGRFEYFDNGKFKYIAYTD